jgi:pyridoxine 5'-phosphate synthase PdxJ
MLIFRVLVNLTTISQLSKLRKTFVFWDVAPCRFCVNKLPPETSVHKRSKRRHIPEDGISIVTAVKTSKSYSVS